eukprot:TRINITY_DN3749_c0_g1_i11.p1 TRINITY_DN3749_c0_g1~~TRINITY_DN3749_c0_g1_i11.p1  ORF type:complete len:423 (-),score=72.48 TRINITY_DN3749_c0_g1_i11:2598-3866(-)
MQVITVMNFLHTCGEPANVPSCMVCEVPLGFLDRHHCKRCGRTVCASCSERRPSMNHRTACVICLRKFENLLIIDALNKEQKLLQDRELRVKEQQCCNTRFDLDPNEQQKLKEANAQILKSFDLSFQQLIEKVSQVPGIPDSISGTFEEKKVELTNFLSSVTSDTPRPLRAVLLGPSGYGKTTLKYCLGGIARSSLTRTKVEDMKWQLVSETLEVLDVVGMKPNEPYPQEIFKLFWEQIMEKIPDIIFIVLSLPDVRNWESWKKSLKTIVTAIQKNNPFLGLHFVGTKLDIANEFQFSFRMGEETVSEYLSYLHRKKILIQEAFSKEIEKSFPSLYQNRHEVSVVFITRAQTWGISDLVCLVNLRSPYDAQLIQYGDTRFGLLIGRVLLVHFGISCTFLFFFTILFPSPSLSPCSNPAYCLF